MSSGECMACAVEWGVCCITGFWCIFCCHACISQQFSINQVRGECNKINAMFFGGRPVFSPGPSGCILVNTDMMGQQIAMVPAPQFIPVPIGGPTMPGYQPIPTAQPVPAEGAAPRSLSVVVPPGAEPGSLLTVTTPEGQSIQVSVPAGAYAGYEFKVQY
jgi:hypothetical protein